MTVLNTMWGTNPAAVAAPTSAELAASTTLAAFQSWNLTAQVSFLNAYGTGNPPQIVLGPPGGQQGLATLTLDGEVATEALPVGFMLLPTALDYATFSSWSQDVQVAYMQANSAAAVADGSTSSLACGSGATAFTAKRYVQATPYNPLDRSTILVPAMQAVPAITPAVSSYTSSMSVADFCALSEADQKGISRNGNGPVALAGATGASTDQTIALQLSTGDSVSIDVPAGTFPGYAANLTAPFSGGGQLVSSVDASTFQSWPKAVQTAYLYAALRASGAKVGTGEVTYGAVVFGSTSASGAYPNGMTATLQGLSPSVGFEVTTTPNDPGFGQYLTTSSSVKAPTAETFLSWSAGEQFAYAVTQRQDPLVLPGTGGGSLDVTLGGSKSDGLKLSSTLPSDSSATLSLDLFALADQNAKAAYFSAHSANATGNMPYLVVTDAGGAKTILTKNGSGAFVADVLPSDYAQPPSQLTSSEFLAWPIAVRMHYLVDNGEGQYWATTFKDGNTCGISATNAVGYISPDLADLTTTGYTKADIPYENLGAAGGQYTVGTTAQTIAGVAATVYTDTTTPSPSTVAPADLDPKVFASWSNSQQFAYVQAQYATNATSKSQGIFTIGSSSTAGYTPVQVLTDSDSAPPQVYTIPSGAAYNAIDPQTFETWSTGQQRAFIKSQCAIHGFAVTVPVHISTPGGASLDVLISQTSSAISPAQVYIVQNLQKTDIAKMSFADQSALTQALGYPALAAAYGLMPNTTTPSTGTTSALATIQALITSYRTGITNPPNPPGPPPPYVQSLFTAQIDLISAQLFGTALPAAPAAGASDYTSNLTAPTLPSSTATQTGGSAIFSETDIQAQLDAIQTRFNRVAAFATEATKKRFVLQCDYSTQSDPSTFHPYLYQPSDDNVTIANNKLLGPSDLLNFLRGNTSPAPPDPQPDAAGVYVPGEGQTTPAEYGISGTAANTIVLNGSVVNIAYVKNVKIYNATLSYGNSNGNPPFPTSIDNDATIRAGYEKFVAQEAAITANKMLAANLAQSGTVAGSNQSLDLPKLLCLYMMYNNNIQQAVVTADSEEVNQVNAVLQEYSSMQQIINATTATSTSNANDQLHLVYGNANTEIQRLFCSQYGASPIEKLYFNSTNWSRPSRGLYVDPTKSANGDNSANTSDTANNWTQFGTQLSDVVTQINQQSQIKMNDVNSETKQQDRYLDLASTALSKLSDTLAQIASAT